MDCPELKELRQKLRGKIGDDFDNMSSILGGKGKDVLNAVLDFTEASGRFSQSRAGKSASRRSKSI